MVLILAGMYLKLLLNLFRKTFVLIHQVVVALYIQWVPIYFLFQWYWWPTSDYLRWITIHLWLSRCLYWIHHQWWSSKFRQWFFIHTSVITMEIILIHIAGIVWRNQRRLIEGLHHFLYWWVVFHPISIDFHVNDWLIRLHQLTLRFNLFSCIRNWSLLAFITFLVHTLVIKWFIFWVILVQTIPFLCRVFFFNLFNTFLVLI